MRNLLLSIVLGTTLFSEDAHADERAPHVDVYAGEHVSGDELRRFAATLQPEPNVWFSPSIPGNLCAYASTSDLEKVQNLLRCQADDPWLTDTNADFVVVITKPTAGAKKATASYLTRRGRVFKTTTLSLEDEEPERIDLDDVLHDLPSVEGPDAPTTNRVVVRPGTEGFVVEAGYEISARFLDYNAAPDVPEEHRRHYNKLGISSLCVGGELWPFAWTDVDILRDIGLRATYSHAAPFESTTQDLMALYDTDARSFTGDLLYRFRLPDSSSFASSLYIGPTTSYRSMSFTPRHDPELVAPDELPAVEYVTVGGAVGLRGLAWSRFQVQPDVRLAGIVHSTGVYDAHEPTSTLTVSGALRLGIALDWGFSLGVMGTYATYLASFDAADAQADGSADHFVSGAATVSYALAALD